MAADEGFAMNALERAELILKALEALEWSMDDGRRNNSVCPSCGAILTAHGKRASHSYDCPNSPPITSARALVVELQGQHKDADGGWRPMSEAPKDEPLIVSRVPKEK